jgi:hypothetical protein
MLPSGAFEQHFMAKMEILLMDEKTVMNRLKDEQTVQACHPAKILSVQFF